MDNSAAILKRVTQKKADYATYSFEKLEMAALNTFFDLAQEYDGLKNLYLIGVTVPHVFFGMQCTLYLIDPETQAITFEASSQRGFGRAAEAVPGHIKITDRAYHHGTSYVVPIHGKKTPASGLLFRGSGKTIGIFEVDREESVTEMEPLFIQKYVNRIGYNLYNKNLAEQNIQHLKFINNLVADIEHNVIVPNLRYKLFFKKIKNYIHTNKDIESDLENILDEVEGKHPDLYAKLSGLVEGMVVINRAMFDDQKKIERHYKNASLFLESLFRRDHFLLGQYILKKRPCYLWKDIVLSQLERYSDRFLEQGIQVGHISDEKEDFKIKADNGLMAQVVANLFSNVIKYTESVLDESGKMVKKFDCDALLLEDFFGQGHHGIRFHVISSGPPIDKEDGARIFDEGFRVTSRDSVKGRGHGLHFVKNVVEVHGGIVGHKSESFGNQFYFVIPT
jgi:signal transduction histidine kinase